MIVETANVDTEDDKENRQRVKLKLRVGASYVSEADFKVFDINGFDIVLGKRWMCDIHCQYKIDHDSNEMWIPDILLRERKDSRVPYLPGLCAVDIDEGIVEQATFMSIRIIQKAELKNISARLLQWAFLLKVHQHSDGDTLLTYKPPGEFQVILTEFQGLFGEPTDANLQNGRQADCKMKTDPNGKIPSCSPHHISPQEEAERHRQIDKEISSGRIQPFRNNYGSPVLFLPMPDGMLHMCIDYRSVNAITVKVHYPLRHIVKLLTSRKGACWFTKLDLAACYDQIRIATADWRNMACSTKFHLYKWRVLLFGLANAPSQFMQMMNSNLEPMKRKCIVVYLYDILIHSQTQAQHVLHVREVLTLLTEHALKAICGICAWACQKVNFCGFDIDNDGIHG